MNINELENLRLGILKEVDKAKPLAMLSTFFIPISSFLAFYYSGYDLDISMIYIIAICLMPIFLSIYEIFEMEKIPQIKYDVFARFAIMLPVFFLINFVEKYKTLGLIGTLVLISFSMFFAYKLIVKEIKIKKAKKI